MLSYTVTIEWPDGTGQEIELNSIEHDVHSKADCIEVAMDIAELDDESLVTITVQEN